MSVSVTKIKKISWYRQGAAGKPLYVSYPLQSCNHFYIKDKPVRLHYQHLIMDFNNDKLTDWLWVDNLKKVSEYYLSLEKNEKGHLSELYKWWRNEYLYPMMDNIQTLRSTSLYSLSDKELLDIYGKISKQYLLAWRNCIFQDAFDYWGDKFLQKQLHLMGIFIDEHRLHDLFQTSSQTIFNQEKKSFRSLQLYINKQSNIKKYLLQNNIFVLREKFPNFYQKLIHHANSYYWIYNDYAVIHNLLPSDFGKKLLDYSEDKKKNKKKNVKISSKKAQPIIDVLSVVASWRDDRKALGQMTSGIIYDFAKELSKRTCRSLLFIEHMLWSEVLNIYNLSAKKELEIKKRMKFGFLCYSGLPDQYNIYSGKKRQLILRGLRQTLISELKGMPVSGGIVKGNIKIIFDQRDFHKFKKNEILVAPNTRPEYVPLMRKAIAVITEEGGITSHAAIVSRELGIPAVVGVQGILDKLKDGDRVEVDANSGVIKII